MGGGQRDGSKIHGWLVIRTVDRGSLVDGSEEWNPNSSGDAPPSTPPLLTLTWEQRGAGFFFCYCFLVVVVVAPELFPLP